MFHTYTALCSRWWSGNWQPLLAHYRRPEEATIDHRATYQAIPWTINLFFSFSVHRCLFSSLLFLWSAKRLHVVSFHKVTGLDVIAREKWRNLQDTKSAKSAQETIVSNIVRIERAEEFLHHYQFSNTGHFAITPPVQLCKFNVSK